MLKVLDICNIKVYDSHMMNHIIKKTKGEGKVK